MRTHSSAFARALNPLSIAYLVSDNFFSTTGDAVHGLYPRPLRTPLQVLSYAFGISQLLDKVLADMNNLELNAQLKAMADEKQGLLEQIGALQQEAERQTLQASRRKELEEWLAQQPMVLTEYDDGVTRRLVERIMVVDAETIRVKLRDTDLEIEQNM